MWKSLSFVHSALFPDVVNCMQTDNLELKKLVYLYLMNYAKSQPDLAILAVNTFVKVSAHWNSVISIDLEVTPCDHVRARCATQIGFQAH